MMISHTLCALFSPHEKNVSTYLGINYFKCFCPFFACAFSETWHLFHVMSIWETPGKFGIPKANRPLASRYRLILRTYHLAGSTVALSAFSLTWNSRCSVCVWNFWRFKMCQRSSHVFLNYWDILKSIYLLILFTSSRFLNLFWSSILGHFLC